MLARIVPLLPPETLHQLIRHSGLDACGELVMSATSAQLTVLLDLDLWRHAGAGNDHAFDVERFGEWLEVLVNTDPALAAQTVAGLDINLVVEGMSRYLRVLDPGIFEPIAQSDDEPVSRLQAMREGDSRGSLPETEVGGYIVRARRPDAWDAVIMMLTALEAGHGDYFRAVMQGCRSLSNSKPEIDGLDDLMAAPAQHIHDVASAREERRSQQGYATPADARAFLEMARKPRNARSGVNPIVAAYFRAADQTPESPDAAAPPAPTLALPSASLAQSAGAAHADGVRANTTDAPETLEAVMEILIDAGVMPSLPRALLAAGDADPESARLAHLRRLMAHVRDTQDATYFARNRELAFLANTLLAGCSIQSRPFTPQEASDAAAAICNLGLDCWHTHWPGANLRGASAPHDAAATAPPDSFLLHHDLVTAFEVGWSVLHRDVCMFAAEQLIATLTNLDSVDRDIRRGLVALRRTLVKQRAARTPWGARDAVEVIALLDMTAWISVLGLLDECPIVPAALMAVVDEQTTTVSPTAFEFISTAEQIDAIHIFMRKLPEVLAG